jgi:DNA-binding MarR family transcriptional regulator
MSTGPSAPIAAALRQTKPFSSPESAAYLAVLRVASRFEQEMSDLLRPHGITPTQYNGLRILRGGGSTGLTCGGVLDRLVTRDPDITRLLDRLEKLGLVTRTRDSEDRRVVISRITPAGLGLLEALDTPVNELHRSQLAALGPDGLQQLTQLLGEIIESQG